MKNAYFIFLVSLAFTFCCITIACNTNRKNYTSESHFIQSAVVSDSYFDSSVLNYLRGKEIGNSNTILNPTLNTNDAIYLCSLLDKGYYDSVQSIADKYDSFSFFRLPGNFNIPVFDNIQNPYGKFFWLKYYSALKGYDAYMCSEMYSHNSRLFEERDSFAFDLITIDNAFYNIALSFEKPKKQNSLDETFQFIFQYQLKYPEYKKPVLIKKLFGEQNNSSLTMLEELLTTPEGFQKELFSRMIISKILRYSDNVKLDWNRFSQLCDKYFDMFGTCNTDILQVYSRFKRFDKKYLDICHKCFELNTGISLEKAKIYQSMHLLFSKNYSLLEENIKSYKSSIKDSVFYSESDFRAYEFSMYELFDLRMKLLTGKYKEYIVALQNISAYNTLISKPQSIQDVYIKTKNLFALDFDSTKIKFDKFYNDNIVVYSKELYPK